MSEKKIPKYDVSREDGYMVPDSDGNYFYVGDIEELKKALLSAEKDVKTLEEVFREYGV